MLDIDGSVLEGGGQILRISISLSAILGIPIRISKIRAGRPKPGLAAQHLNGIKLVADMCQARLRGAQLGSTEVEFVPGKIRGQHFMADTKTAGSVSLLLQVALPCALMADGPVTLDLRGGTDADMAPQIDYMKDVFRPVLNHFKANFDMKIHRRGYFPKGGGHVTVDINPVRKLRSITLTEPGRVLRVRGYSAVTGLPPKIAHVMAENATKKLRDMCGDVKIEPVVEEQRTSDRCNRIFVWCETSTDLVLGSDAIGKPRQDAAELAAKVAATLQTDTRVGACLDHRAQDQVIIYMALAEGASTVRVGEVTSHTRTAIYVAELIAKTKFRIQEDNEGNNLIECTGIGFINKNITESNDN